MLLVGLALVAILVPILLVLLGVESSMPVYSYVSSDGKFDEIEMPSKGRSLDMVEAHFDEYRRQVGQPDLILYRTTSRVWWRYWRWSEYVSHPRWSYPYREPDPREEAGR